MTINRSTVSQGCMHERPLFAHQRSGELFTKEVRPYFQGDGIQIVQTSAASHKTGGFRRSAVITLRIKAELVKSEVAGRLKYHPVI